MTALLCVTTAAKLTGGFSIAVAMGLTLGCAQKEAPAVADTTNVGQAAPGHATAAHQAPSGINPFCPQPEFRATVKAMTDSGGVRILQDLTVTNIDLAEDIDEIPEYHDCQKLATGQGSDYGPLVAIWASSHLDDLLTQIRTAQASNPNNAVAAATILNRPGDGEYAPLHIPENVSCLYLWENPAAGAPRWKAAIVAANDVSVCKNGVVDITQHSPDRWKIAADPELNSVQADDIPPVIRWEWGRDDKNYIGIKCGTQWCGVGGPNFRFSVTRSPNWNSNWRELEAFPNRAAIAITDPRAKRVLMIKGWHDEQRLGVPSSTGLQRGLVTGYAFPHPDLDDAMVGSVVQNEWTPIAYVVVDGDYSQLRLKLGFNKIQVCEGNNCISTSRCNNPSLYARRIWVPPLSSGANPDTTEMCVRATPHTMPVPRGTARWAWSDNDEQLWIRCPQGCCQVN